MSTKDKLEKLENQVNEINSLSSQLDQLTTVVDQTENDNYEIIRDVVTNNIDPKDEVNQKVNMAHKAIRKIGNRFLNLFKITFTVEFAGTMLIHWTIPRIDENGNTTNR